MVSVGWAMWYVVLPNVHDAAVQFQNDGEPAVPSTVVGDATDGAVFLGEDAGGNIAKGVDGAAEGFGNISDKITDAVGGVTDAVVGVGDAVDGALMIAPSGNGDDDEVVVMWTPPSSAASSLLEEEEEEEEAAKTTSDENTQAEPPDYSDIYIRNDTGFKQSLTHRYVMYPPCAAVLDSMGKETRTIFGFPTPIPLDQGSYDVKGMEIFDANKMAAKGAEPKPCKFDHNGNHLDDGWEDLNNDGYADGFSDCTKPYRYEDGWYVRELGRDCKYGLPGPVYEYRNQGVSGTDDDGSGESNQPLSPPSTSTSTPPPPPTTTTTSKAKPVGRDIPYATAITGTISRVIDGDTILVNGDTTIRLALVDTPERGQPGYEAASTFTRTQCPSGTTIIYDADDGQRGGSYGRLIALVWCAGIGHTASNAAVTLNEMLLIRGYAEIDKRFCGASEFGDDEWAVRGGC